MSDGKKIMKTLNGYTVYDEDAHRRIDSLAGSAPGLVFDTVADMEAYVAEHSAELKVGQNLYIREVDVPDYWWDGTAAQELEVKEDLSGYAKQEEVDQLSKEIGNKLDASKLPEAVNTALAQAKESGEFDGEDGSDYVLTEADKNEIAQEAAGLVDTALLNIIGSGVVA